MSGDAGNRHRSESPAEAPRVVTAALREVSNSDYLRCVRAFDKVAVAPGGSAAVQRSLIGLPDLALKSGRAGSAPRLVAK